MVTRTELYGRVNSQWPEVMPTPTADEAAKAARKLYRFATGRTFTGPVQVTSGNRYTYGHHGKLFVNPNGKHHGGGWKAFVHELSHYLHPRVNPGDKPHDKSHARLELRLIKEVLKRGWLDGTLKGKAKAPEPPKDRRALVLQRTEAAIQRWESKRKRADNALKKLNRRKAYYMRATEQSKTLH